MSSRPVPSFGMLLKRHRRAVAFTQEALAERAGISVDTISALERGVNVSPRNDTVDLLAEALQLSGPERADFEAAARLEKRQEPANFMPLAPISVTAQRDGSPEEPTMAGEPEAPIRLVDEGELEITLGGRLAGQESAPLQRPGLLPVRRHRRYFVLGLIALLVFVAASSGLGYWQKLWPFGKVGSAPCYVYAPPTHTGGTITFSWPLFNLKEWNSGSWNPWFTSTADLFELENALWGTPYVTSPCGDLLPDELAEIPTQANGDVSQDGRAVTMRLRPDLKWSDGQPITAYDFAYWLEVLLDPALKDEVASSYGYDQISSHQVLDDHTLVLHYKLPYSPFLYYLPMAAPRHAWGRIPHQDLSQRVEVNRNPSVTSGPFMVASYNPDQSSITMVPNPYYTSTTLHHSVLSRLVFKTYPDVDALITAFETGQIEYGEVFRRDDFLKVAGLPDARNTPYSSSHNLYFNLTNPVLQDLQVRKAIEEAIDRCELIKEVFQQPCEHLRVDTILPKPSPAYDPTITTYPFNLVQARQDMQIAGWNCASGTCIRDGKPFPTLRLVTSKEDMVRNRTAELIKHDLEVLGIPVSLNLSSGLAVFSSYAQGGLLATGQFDLAIFGVAYGLDTYGNLADFDSKEIPNADDPGGGNWERLNDPLIDHALDQALITLDMTKQTSRYEAIQRVLIEKVYVVPLYLNENITLVSPNVGNEQNSPLGVGNMWNVSDWFLIK